MPSVARRFVCSHRPTAWGPSASSRHTVRGPAQAKPDRVCGVRVGRGARLLVEDSCGGCCSCFGPPKPCAPRISSCADSWLYIERSSHRAGSTRRPASAWWYWRDALVVVQPARRFAGHAGWRLLWRMKSLAGRSPIPDERRCASDRGIIQSRHSRRIVPMTRSQIPFVLGLENGERSTQRSDRIVQAPRENAVPVMAHLRAGA